MVNVIRQRRDHVDLSVLEAADRLAIRELIDAYAFCADRRDVAGQLALFTEDTELVVFADSRNPEPTRRFRGRAALAPVFDELKNYQATMHFNGQCTTTLDGLRASAVTDCLVHELSVDETAHTLMIVAIRYLDSLVKKDGKWLIRQRQVAVDWTETRALQPAKPSIAPDHQVRHRAEKRCSGLENESCKCGSAQAVDGVGDPLLQVEALVEPADHRGMILGDLDVARYALDESDDLRRQQGNRRRHRPGDDGEHHHHLSVSRVAWILG